MLAEGTRNWMAPAGHSLAVVLPVAIMAALLSAWLVRRMIALAVMDVPGRRSAHDRPVPKGGGVGMVAAVLLGTPAMLMVLDGRSGQVLPAGLMLLAVLLLGGVSWLDDVRQFGFQAKLAAQVGAALLAIAAVAATLRVLPPVSVLLPGGLVAGCWLMLAMNAMNFIDGINGLAAGCTALACLAAAAIGFGNPLPWALGLTTAAGLLGFLPFNYPRARIFLGDVGSQVCGLVAGSLALFELDGSRSGTPVIAVPLMLAGILWDVLFTLLRRALAGERLTQAHRGHLYQVASRCLIPAVAVTVLHWGFVVWGAMLAWSVLPASPVLAISLALVPQAGWTLVVRRRAARAGLGAWSA